MVEALLGLRGQDNRRTKRRILSCTPHNDGVAHIARVRVVQNRRQGLNRPPCRRVLKCTNPMSDSTAIRVRRFRNRVKALGLCLTGVFQRAATPMEGGQRGSRYAATEIMSPFFARGYSFSKLV